MNRKQEDVVHRAIVDGIIASTPDTWDEIYLTLTHNLYPNGDEGLAHELSCPQAHPTEFAEPTQALYDATRQLLDICKRRGQSWRSAKYHVTKKSDSSWSFVVDFSY
jgi:hypothetical protein